MNSVGILNLTDRLTDGINPSAFNSSCQQYRRIYRRIYSVGISYTHRWIYRRIFSVDQSQYHQRNENPSVYFKRESFFFGTQILSVKPSANGFLVFPTDIATEGGITNEGKADRHNPSVMTSVKKSPTNFLSHTDGIGPSVKL
jgi:hypothetical protein